ncbi:MAG: MaoC family dehydratase [Chloroflexi bacterium]|nr:MaoC family dehydratase [Chloroflexota bacterium]MBM4450996.1 MaoC family dehydratase [Chloroflexota bacterium]
MALLNDALRKLVGMSTDPYIYKIEEGAIQRYADAIGDPNPLFNDIGYAKKSKAGRLLCPPGFFGWPVKKGPGPLTLAIELIKAGAPFRLLDGGVEYEFFEPVGAGDVLTMHNKIVDITEKESKSGSMLLTTIEATFLNQNGDVVAKARSTFINR